MDFHLRERKDSDQEFVKALFCRIRVIELKAETWPEQLKDQITSMQFEAFEKAMTDEYPGIQGHILMVDSERIGWYQQEESEKVINAISLFILPEYQGNGIGSKLLRNVINDSKIKRKPVYFEVEKVNPAFNLYKRLGFKVHGENELKYFMNYTPD